jgi:hypothetical protein
MLNNRRVFEWSVVKHFSRRLAFWGSSSCALAVAGALVFARNGISASNSPSLEIARIVGIATIGAILFLAFSLSMVMALVFTVRMMKFGAFMLAERSQEYRSLGFSRHLLPGFGLRANDLTPEGVVYRDLYFESVLGFMLSAAGVFGVGALAKGLENVIS